MPTIGHKFSSICLLLLCFQVSSAKDTDACSDGVCAAKTVTDIGSLDVFDQASDLSLIQLTSMEKRAQDTGASAGGQSSVSWLDATYKRKADPERPKTFAERINAEMPALWSMRAAGCCAGERDEDNGKLFGENVTDIEACKMKCRSRKDCGSIEYGWKDMPNWCFVWSASQKCEKMDPDCKLSVPGNGKGVRNYLYNASARKIPDVSETNWKVIGDGCCDGLRHESNGKLYADKEKSLDACKARCLSFINCGIVEYGWTKGDPEWCYIWSTNQTCEKKDKDCKQSVLGSGEGAKQHKYMKA